jgi:hypothetical protein
MELLEDRFAGGFLEAAGQIELGYRAHLLFWHFFAGLEIKGELSRTGSAVPNVYHENAHR